MITQAPEIPCLRRTEPLIPVGHPEFVWHTGADVQATWKRYGWTPPTFERVPAEDTEGGGV